MKSNGVATILLMIPVLTVPALAIFGIPQFAPVVASPLEEGGSRDRESRVGNSARLSHDELFDDVSPIDSDDAIAGAASSIRDRNLSNKLPSNTRIRQTDAVPAATWGDDLESVPENPKSKRLMSSRSKPGEQGNIVSGDPSNSVAGSPAQIPIEKLRYERNTQSSRKKSEAVRQPPSRESNHLIQQVGYTDNPSDAESQSDSMSADRPKSTPRRNPKANETSGEDLTWNSAVEQLNELEIRNFRLEPGPRMGLFVFICSYTPLDAPSISYRFEAEADQPLKAVQKVLEQIVEWRQRR